jgi:hypothetical protein
VRSFEVDAQKQAGTSILINNSPNWYQNDRNRVNFLHNQIPLNLELHKEINYRFSKIGG